ncbi:hypothetical protein GCM10009416_48600 [Craurococcus roseus]|uniref:Uncharacterized protein n=2 Tax=Craurococcus roseus TaxID=77585 RepID=A0ABP3R9X2_9PROT
MAKMSLLLMAVLTVLVFMGLRWREERMASAAKPAPKAPRPGWLATQKRAANRWVTAAAIAALATIVLLGGIHWVRELSGGW